MVKGISKFREFFQNYENNYVVIGGTACDILDEQYEFVPRATKDIDIILNIEALSDIFVERFWDFIKTANYKTRQRGNGKSEYFRFLNPDDTSFPYQIELFSRKLDLIKVPDDARLTPIPVSEMVSSLSAILMDDDYYSFTINKSEIVDGIRIASPIAIIALKIMAFLNMLDSKQRGERIDSSDIKKHKNDIFKIGVFLGTTTEVEIPPQIRSDVSRFLNIVEQAKPSHDILANRGASIEDVLVAIRNQFGV